MIAAANDDHVLAATSYIQFPLGDEAQVPAAQVGLAEAIIRQMCPKRQRILVLAVPITAGDGRPGDPNLPNFVCAATASRLRIDDGNFLVEQGSAAAHQRLRVAVFPSDVYHAVPRQFISADRLDDRAFWPAPTRNDQRRFGQAVAGIKRLSTKSARLEGLDEIRQSARAYGLRPAEGHPPTRQIELPALFGRRLLHTQLVGE